ncbi:MAG: hypothetical protein GY772_18080, partial [bacterium]|nr:hypothetical protein [bacterium]
MEFLAVMSAFVARPVRPLEWLNNPEAWAAVQKEWEMLRKIGTWDEASVREWRDVARDARRTGEKMHVGRIFTLCFEKNYELEDGNPARKFKGRVVFRGNDVRDETWEAAMFEELSSNLATMEAAKAADCYGLVPGHEVWQADAERAYTQAKLRGVTTWVR